MEAKKLISVRLDQETLDNIDKFLEHRSYYTRSSVIASLLHTIMKCADDVTLLNMMTTRFLYEKGYTVRFEIDKDLMVSRAKQAANKF